MRREIDRARRNALKTAGLISGAILATILPQGQASAQALERLRPIRPSPPRPIPGRGGSCFARGTRILTRDGYRPIETLKAGDEVAVHSGGFAPIKAMLDHSLNWMGGYWDGNPHNLPVVIRRGALDENSPTEDLCLTALHAVYVDGFLMNAGDLINGTTITFMTHDGRDVLDFFGIELEGSDILMAQGAPCESFYKAGTERCAPHLAFDGRRSRVRSHMRSAASLVIDRRQPIDIIRDRIDERGLGLARAA